MGKLSKAPTEKDIDELIAEAKKAMEEISELNGPATTHAYHKGGADYLELLKTRLELDRLKDSQYTGKKLLKSSVKKKGEKLLKAKDEAIGAEVPTDYNAGYIDGVKDYAAAMDVEMEDKDWKASAQRGEAA